MKIITIIQVKVDSKDLTLAIDDNGNTYQLGYWVGNVLSWKLIKWVTV